jgi:putative DNA modification/repair radical SAM protein
VVRKLRREERFNGYIHLKVIPGANRTLIREAGLLVDRLSVNIELPSEQGLRRLAPQKQRNDILTPMAYIGTKIQATLEERHKFKKALPFVPAGQSTQMIVGASPETDYQILRLTEQLYQRVNLRRVYYSAYIPVNPTPLLPVPALPPLKREHRLYQADWLIRFYRFRAEEIVNRQYPELDANLDPKSSWALRHLEFFPIEINRADFDELVRIPGVGLKSAQRIVAARRFGALNLDHLSKLGVVILTCQGKFLERQDDEWLIRQQLLALELPHKFPDVKNRQLPLFKDGAFENVNLSL